MKIMVRLWVGFIILICLFHIDEDIKALTAEIHAARVQK